MTKVKTVKHWRIKEGDLIEFKYQEIDSLNIIGYVTKVNHDIREITAVWSDDFKESPVYYNYDYEPIVGHWEVVKETDQLSTFTCYNKL